MFVNNNRDASLSAHPHGQKKVQESKIDAMRKYIPQDNAAKSLSSREMAQISESDPLARS
jgi:hypothetical protein